MRRQNNLQPDDPGICRRLFRYIINGLSVTKGLYPRAKTKRADPRKRFNSADHGAGYEIQVFFKQTDDDQPEYRNSNDFVTVMPAPDPPKIKTINIEGVAVEDKEKKKGKMVAGERRTVVLNRPAEDPKPGPSSRPDAESDINEKSDKFIRRRQVLLDVESNINEKSDQFIRRLKDKMGNIPIEPKAY